jgi:cytoskeletal protein CcmA (bactofilin family)
MTHLDDHFDEMTCMLYLDGQLDAERARELSSHARDCAACRDLLRALEGEGRWLHDSLVEENEDVPARIAEPPSRAGVPWGWISAFGLGAAGAYTLWNDFIDPLQQQFSQAGFSGSSLLTLLFFSDAFRKGWETMANLVGFLATGTLGILVLVLLRRYWRRRATFALVMGLSFCVLALSQAAGAAEVKKGVQTYVLPAGEVLHKDLVIGAKRTQIDGTIDGDLIASSGDVTINGRVTGDVLACAGEVRVNGQVDGNVRNFSGSLVVDGSVGKNVTAFSGSVEMRPKSHVGGSLTAFAGHVRFESSLGRDFLGFVGHTELNGLLGGDVMLRGKDLNVGSDADIRGFTKFEGERPPDVAAGAKLASPVQFVLRKHGSDRTSPVFYWHQALIWAAAFVLGLVLILLVPGFFHDVVGAVYRYAPSIGFGLVAVVVTPVAVALACLTLVGLGAGLTTLLLYLIALYASQIFVATWLGETLLGKQVGTAATIGRLALGLFVIRLLRIIPYFGTWVLFLELAWGMGALVVALYRNVRARTAVA